MLVITTVTLKGYVDCNAILTCIQSADSQLSMVHTYQAISYTHGSDLHTWQTSVNEIFNNRNDHASKHFYYTLLPPIKASYTNCVCFLTTFADCLFSVENSHVTFYVSVDCNVSVHNNDQWHNLFCQIPLC